MIQEVTWEAPFDALMEKLIGWGQQAILALPNLIAATLVLLVFWVASRALRSTFARVLARTHAPQPIQRLLVQFAGMAVIAAGFSVALGILELDKALASLLAGAGILGLAVGFAFQDIAANFMAGLIIALRRPFNIGDLIETNGYFGSVDHIELRTTRIRIPEGQLILIPNRDVFNKPITNFTQSGERRVDISVGVSYGDDLDKAERVTAAAIERVADRAKRPIEVFFEKFGDSSVNLVVRFWLDSTQQGDYMAARSAAIMSIRQAYRENDITIPFPIRTLDFGIVGGEKLSEALPPSLYERKEA
jgi:small conductance mechanosensitive channel